VQFQLGQVDALIDSVDDAVALYFLVPELQVGEGLEELLRGQRGGD
jgi:hypothetical protein